jgi:hypothetical protein
LLDDVELSRLKPEQLVLKASRLARLINDDDTLEWLRYELNGYPAGDTPFEIANRFGRVTDVQQRLGYWHPLAGIIALEQSMAIQIQQLQVPSVHFAPSSANPNEYVAGWGGTNVQKLSAPAQAVLVRLQALTTAVGSLSSIRSRVLAALHAFVTNVFYKGAFEEVARTIFEGHESSVLGLLRDSVPDAFDKIPAIRDRLLAGDPEAVSQALNSCRRMIRAFADAVYPPSDGSVTVDGQSYEIGKDKVLNRVQLYLKSKCPSASRTERLIRNLRQIHERASGGAHGEVTVDEARNLFLQTFMTLGEILSATSASSERVPTPPDATGAARQQSL